MPASSKGPSSIKKKPIAGPGSVNDGLMMAGVEAALRGSDGK